MACVEVTTLPAKLWQAPSTLSAMVSYSFSLCTTINLQQVYMIGAPVKSGEQWE